MSLGRRWRAGGVKRRRLWFARGYNAQSVLENKGCVGKAVRVCVSLTAMRGPLETRVEAVTAANLAFVELLFREEREGYRRRQLFGRGHFFLAKSFGKCGGEGWI